MGDLGFWGIPQEIAGINIVHGLPHTNHISTPPPPSWKDQCLLSPKLRAGIMSGVRTCHSGHLEHGTGFNRRSGPFRQMFRPDNSVFSPHRVASTPFFAAKHLTPTWVSYSLSTPAVSWLPYFWVTPTTVCRGYYTMPRTTVESNTGCRFDRRGSLRK